MMRIKDLQGEFRLFELLQMPPGGLWLKRTDFNRWGRVYTVYLCYDHDNEQIPFHITLTDCRRIHWDVHGEDADIDDFGDEVNIIGVDFHPADEGRTRLVIASAVVEISIEYGEMIFEKDAAAIV
jgi:hypothetical protein